MVILENYTDFRFAVEAGLEEEAFFVENKEGDGQQRVVLSRFLESSSEEHQQEQKEDAQVLRNTFLLYGFLMAVVLLLFCILRQICPRPYTIRQWNPRIHTRLANKQTNDGFISWIWKLAAIDDDAIRTDCGMDALCYLRLLRMGTHIAIVGMLNALWLAPLYATAETFAGGAHSWWTISIAHLSSGSSRFLGPVVAAYLLFGYTMRSILHELKWFVKQRNKFLLEERARNYAVFVRHVPPQYQNHSALQQFFKNNLENAPEVHLVVDAPNLRSMVERLTKLRQEMEHFVALEQPTRDEIRRNDSSVQEWGSLQRKIQQERDRLRRLVEQPSVPFTTPQSSIDRDDNTSTCNGAGLDPLQETGVSWVATSAIATDEAVASTATQVVTSSINRIQRTEEDDGSRVLSGGFVVFSSLWSVHAALQMIQDDDPYQMEVLEAPDPEDVVWSNIGVSHDSLMLGVLLSFSASGALCLFWTIPITFIASLSEIHSLREHIPVVDKLIDNFPLVEPAVEQLAPLLVSMVNMILPYILQTIAMLELPVSAEVVQASLFSKLSAFMIIQTFFVSAVSGGIMQEITRILDKPKTIIDLLAKSLPSQSTYFLQIVVSGLVILLASDLLRVTSIAMALLRRCIGPRLTQKERDQIYIYLRPLSQPAEFWFAYMLSQIILYFTILLVYAVISPITSFVLGFCFIFAQAMHRHQFIYIYPPTADSGGMHWTRFIQTLLVSMLIAECTIVGFLSLKKATLAVPLMMPLIVVTSLFSAHIHQKHFRMAEFLPARLCQAEDTARRGTLDLASFVKGVYIQPEMKDDAEDMSSEFMSKLERARNMHSDIEEGENQSLLQSLLPWNKQRYT